MSLFKEAQLDHADARATVVPTHSVLIVDDEVGNLRVLRAMLGDRFRILEAADGSEALELLARLPAAQRPAIVLSDQRMPKMTGVELFERLRESLPEAIRIIITGFVDVGAIVDSINRAGIYKFVVKPFNHTELKLTIERALEAFEQQRTTQAEVSTLRRQVEALTREIEGLRRSLGADAPAA